MEGSIRKTVAFAALIGIFLAGGEAAATPVTWVFGGAPVFTVFGAAAQPVTFSADGFDTQAAGYTFATGVGGSLSLTARALGKGALPGIGVCDGGLGESDGGCGQIDRVGRNDVLRIALPGPDWRALSVVVGLAGGPFSGDAFALFGSNTADPTNTSDLNLLTAGLVAGVGDDLGLGFWRIPIHAASNFEYLFFTTAAGNDGYSLRNLRAVDPVPEPGTLLLLASGLAGWSTLRRRGKT